MFIRLPSGPCRAANLLAVVAAILLGPLTFAAQNEAPSNLVETGQVSISGRTLSYRIRNLPVNAFPDLPGPIAEALTARGCVIPQTYQAHRPENVIHASLERPGSDDWAVLCSTQKQISLLVFFATASAAQPVVLAQQPSTQRLQPHDLTGVLGFNWGIDPATPKQVHDAQAGMSHRPVPPDHDCLADSQIDQHTIFHLFRNGAWEMVDTQ